MKNRPPALFSDEQKSVLMEMEESRWLSYLSVSNSECCAVLHCAGSIQRSLVNVFLLHGLTVKVVSSNDDSMQLCVSV